MIKKENKRIIFQAIVIVVITSILITNVKANLKEKIHEIYNNPVHSYNYLVFGRGYIWDININGEGDKIGILEGCLSIKNKPGWSTPENYKLYVFNKNFNKLYSKDTLPKQFSLENFSGLGYIKYINFPHSIDATKYLIIGKADYLIKEI